MHNNYHKATILLIFTDHVICNHAVIMFSIYYIMTSVFIVAFADQPSLKFDEFF